MRATLQWAALLIAGMVATTGPYLWRNAKDEADLAALKAGKIVRVCYFPANMCDQVYAKAETVEKECDRMIDPVPMPSSFGPEQGGRLCINAVAEKWSKKYLDSPANFKAIVARSRFAGGDKLSDAQLNDLWFNETLKVFTRKCGRPKAEMIMNRIRIDNNCR